MADSNNAPKTHAEIMSKALIQEQARRAARRFCDEQDHADGYTQTQALRGFAVRCAVADYAANHGRKLSGERIVEAPKALPVVSDSDSASLPASNA